MRLGAPKRPKCWRSARQADAAVVSGHQKSSVHLEKVSMMTRMCESSGKGPMKSMLMVSNGLYVDEAK